VQEDQDLVVVLIDVATLYGVILCNANKTSFVPILLNHLYIFPMYFEGEFVCVVNFFSAITLQ